MVNGRGPGAPARCALILLACLGFVARASAVDGFDQRHTVWTDLLQRHVQWVDQGHASQVDYRGFANERERLHDYLDALSALPESAFRSWSADARRAFLINAYNAFTIELLLDRYPEIESIRDLGSWFRSPWQLRFFQLLGKERSLDEVEHELLRGNTELADPRIHFAVNCASIGCPALRPEAYDGDRLGAQLDDQTQRFLSDRSRNRISGGTLIVSRLFDWYAVDFGSADGEVGDLLGFLKRHADALADTPEQAAQLRGDRLSIEFGAYDWSLNDRSP